MDAEKAGDLFQALGLSVQAGDVEVGKTYPIFGLITRFIDDTLGHVKVEINHNIVARMNITDEDKVELLKVRSFESGIFVCHVLTLQPSIEVECQTVIFGKTQSYHA